jgi:hypothetical protein
VRFASSTLQSLVPPSYDGQKPLTDQIDSLQTAVIDEPSKGHE